MSCKDRCWQALVLSGVLLATGASWAGPPIFSLVPFRKVEVDANKDYNLAEKNGPWMIMATSFAGESAETQARQLVLELRRDHQLPAYVYHQVYDHSEPVIGLGVDKYGNPRKMRPHNREVVDEWAVVVGNFKSFEDPDAAAALEHVRTVQVKSSGVVMPKTAKDKPVSMGKVREYFSKITKQDSKQPRGPLGKAFITRNPLLPKEQVAKGSLDPFVKDLNQGIEYSLLQNPRKYTVQVATFRGATAFSEQEFEDTLKKHRNSPKIDEAAVKATKMVAALRKQGAEAYVFHDRFESIVTVGAFDELGSEGLGEKGRVELQPEVAKIIKRYEAERKSIPGSEQVALSPRMLEGIPFDVSPQLIMVPRENLADVYGRNQ